MENIYQIGQKLGISKEDIKTSIIKKKKAFIVSGIVIAAIALLGNIYYLGMYYGGISIEDFDIFKRFPLIKLFFARFF